MLLLVSLGVVVTAGCGATPPTPASPPSSAVPGDAVDATVVAPVAELGPDPRDLVDGLPWPPRYAILPLTDLATQQLTDRLTEDPRVAPFVVDAGAIALGRDGESVGVVLAVRLVPEAAADPSFRASLATELVGLQPITGDRLWMGGTMAVWWVDSTFVVVDAPDAEVRERLLGAIAAGTA